MLNKWLLQPESNCNIYQNPPEIFPEEKEDFILLSCNTFVEKKCGRTYIPAGHMAALTKRRSGVTANDYMWTKRRDLKLSLEVCIRVNTTRILSHMMGAHVTGASRKLACRAASRQFKCHRSWEWRAIEGIFSESRLITDRN